MSIDKLLKYLSIVEIAILIEEKVKNIKQKENISEQEAFKKVFDNIEKYFEREINTYDVENS